VLLIEGRRAWGIKIESEAENSTISEISIEIKLSQSSRRNKMRFLILLLSMLPMTGVCERLYNEVITSKDFFEICETAEDSYDRAKAAGKGYVDVKSYAPCITYVTAYISAYHQGVFHSAAVMAKRDGANNISENYDKYSKMFLEFCLDESILKKDGEPNLIKPILDYFKNNEGSLNERLDDVVPKAYAKAFPCKK
jgi:hypothetical protein